MHFSTAVQKRPYVSQTKTAKAGQKFLLAKDDLCNATAGSEKLGPTEDTEFNHCACLNAEGNDQPKERIAPGHLNPGAPQRSTPVSPPGTTGLRQKKKPCYLYHAILIALAHWPCGLYDGTIALRAKFQAFPLLLKPGGGEAVIEQGRNWKSLLPTHHFPGPCPDGGE